MAHEPVFKLGEKLGEILIEAGVLTPAQVNQALARQRGTAKRFGELVVELGFATERDVARALETQRLTIYERLKSRVTELMRDRLQTNSHSLDGLRAAREALQVETGEMIESLLQAVPEIDVRAEDRERLKRDVVSEVLGFGPIGDLLTDETVTEIMINGPSQLFVERQGRLEAVEGQFQSVEQLFTVIERLLGSEGLAVTESEPVCDASLPDGTRINVVVPPVVLNGPTVTIRRKLRQWTMAEYVASGALSAQAAQFLEACVRARINLIVSGGTSTGKTTLVGVLSNAIPADERVVTIENVAELELTDHRHWIRLVARQPNLQGRGEIPLRTLVRNSLRMRPDRIILGEARGGEALDVVQAMQSGHEGTMTVLHANSPEGALERLETLMLMSGVPLPASACRAQIANTTELVVHLARYADGRRGVSSIAQVLGDSKSDAATPLEALFTLDLAGASRGAPVQPTLRYTGARPTFLQKFYLNNIPLPAWVVSS